MAVILGGLPLAGTDPLIIERGVLGAAGSAEGLERVARVAGGAYGRPQAAQAVVEEARRVVGCDTALLLGPGADSRSVVVEAAAPAGGDVWTGAKWEVGGEVNRVFARCFYHSESPSGPLRVVFDRLQRAGMRTWVGLPLRREPDGAPLGLLVIAATEPDVHLRWAGALRPIVNMASRALGRVLTSPARPADACELTAYDFERMQALSNLTFGISHSLGNIFGSILGNLYLLSGELSDAGMREVLKRVEDSTCAGMEMMNSLHGFASQPPAAAQPVDLSEMCVDVVEFIRALGCAGVELRACPGEGCVAWGDAPRLRECLINIVFNGIWAAGCGGRVEVLARREDHECRMSVSDNGPGMTAEVRRRAPEPFFTTRGPGHQGLGLAVARGIAVAHRGRIEIHSEPGKGTRVDVFLPTEPPAASGPAEQLITGALERLGA